MTNDTWSSYLAWAIVVILGYPTVTLGLSETTRRLERSSLARPLKVIQNAVLPAVALWILIHQLSPFSADGVVFRIVDTTVGILVLYAILLLGQMVALAVRGTTEAQAPRLFFELVAIAIVVVGGAFIISTVWDIELGTLFGALGVGSVVLGLALQSVIGGLANGLIVLSGRHFAIGDWLRLDQGFVKVVQVDWRAVTLESGGERIVVPSSRIAADTLRIVRSGRPFVVNTSIVIPSAYPPARVTDALLVAARGIPESIGPESAGCRVAEWTAGGIRYVVSVSVDNPAKIDRACSTLLDRIWCVLPRHGISLMRTGDGRDIDVGSAALDWGTTVEERARLLADSGALRDPVAGLEELADQSRVERYATGEFLLEQGASAIAFFVLLDGSLSMLVDMPKGPRTIDRLSAGQIFALRQSFRGSSSPVSLIADEASTVIAIPGPAMQRMLDRNRKLAADIDAAIDARADAIRALASKGTDIETSTPSVRLKNRA
ncbi:mechanosensitive ion channel family protein [Inquilinus sp. OTU3971]|uniref:mechanosensitive ion channel family protein n=1 Tax=Inquilinus sp. OTU3971 TaxID=3043855 RepID=UPI00313B735E